MKREEIEKLLGGFATGTLTEEERGELFREALASQQLFDALADEEALRELLADPVYRAELIDLMSEPAGSREELVAAAAAPMPVRTEVHVAWWRTPFPVALAAALALTILSVTIVSRGWRQKEVQQVAVLKKAPPALSSPAQEPAIERAKPEAKEEYRSSLPASKGRLPRSTPEAVPPPRAIQAPAQNQLGDEERKQQKDQRENAPAPPAEDLSQKAISPLQAGGVTTQQQGVGGQQQTAQAEFAQRQRADQIAQSSQQGMQTRQMAAEPALRNEQAASQLSPAAPAATPPPPELTWSLERLGPAGSYSAVASGTEFRSGESIRLVVEPQRAGLLTVQIREMSGGTRQLFSSRVESGKRYLVPASGALPSQEGERTLLMTFASAPISLGGLSNMAGARMKSGSLGARQGAAMERDAGKVGGPVPVEIPLWFRP